MTIENQDSRAQYKRSGDDKLLEWYKMMINNGNKTIASTAIGILGNDIDLQIPIHRKAAELFIKKVLNNDNAGFNDIDKALKYVKTHKKEFNGMVRLTLRKLKYIEDAYKRKIFEEEKVMEVSIGERQDFKQELENDSGDSEKLDSVETKNSGVNGEIIGEKSISYEDFEETDNSQNKLGSKTVNSQATQSEIQQSPQSLKIAGVSDENNNSGRSNDFQKEGENKSYAVENIPGKDKNEKEKALKFKIIDDIVNLKEEINKYNEARQKTLEKEIKLFEKLDIIKQHFENVINNVKNFLINKYGGLNENIEEKVKIINEKFLKSLESIDSNILSVFILEELFDIEGLELIKGYLRDNVDVKEFNVNLENVKNLQYELNTYGTTEYIDHKGNDSGPVLVIFPETHNGGRLITDNYNALKNTMNYYNFVAVEGENTERNLNDREYHDIISYNSGYDGDLDDISKLESHYMPEYRNYTLLESVSMSAKALETVLKETMDTVGVENFDFMDIFKGHDIINRQKYNSNNQEWDIEITEEEWREYFKKYEGKTYLDEAQETNNLSGDNVIIKYRNYFWLKNIKEKLTQQDDKKGTNIIPITCGFAHMDDLIRQSEIMGFKGVIKFIGNEYYQPYNVEEAVRSIMAYRADNN